MTYKTLALALPAAGLAVIGFTAHAPHEQRTLQDDPPHCCPKPIADAVPAGMHLCVLQGYIGLFVADPDECRDGAIQVGTLVTFARVNKIVGGIGDANMDGDCNADDLAAIVSCVESPEPDCVCTFDYDGDNDVDLRDFQGFQVAFGTGNSRWKAEGAFH